MSLLFIVKTKTNPAFGVICSISRLPIVLEKFRLIGQATTVEEITTEELKRRIPENPNLN
jgi:hypothetical protein